MDKSFCPYVSSALLSLDSIYSVFIQRRKEEGEGAGCVGRFIKKDGTSEVD